MGSFAEPPGVQMGLVVLCFCSGLREASALVQEVLRLGENLRV